MTTCLFFRSPPSILGAVPSGPWARSKTWGRDVTAQELQALRDALIGAAGNPSSEVETPQLGRVLFKSSADIEAALGLIDRELEKASGALPYGVINIEASRGLS